MPYKKLDNKSKKKISSTPKVKRISISLSPTLLDEFDRSMGKTGFTDRSKAIQTALHSFIDDSNWVGNKDNKHSENEFHDEDTGAGAIILLYDNHVYNQDSISTQVQHNYNDVICASTHLHLNEHNCLESIMVNGKAKRIRELAKKLSENRGIKSIKVNFVSIV
ncbi:MAG TPA: CopG family ribbon-helix-helix protein [Verrucomicrobiae bacterium]|nr:CopG family ribbon-helix-helix protein [Verrucomicrobiae bacterium]